MTKEEMAEKIKKNLRLDTTDYDLTISDCVDEAVSFCNLDPEKLPDLLEPVVRKKIKGIVDFEAAKGIGYQQDISSIKEGDGSITFATDGSNSREGIYNLTDADKTALKRFRRLRGYD